jgi:hypothetical protein
MPANMFEGSPDTLPGRPVAMPGAGQPPAAGGGLRVRRPSVEGGDVMNAPDVPGGEARRHPPTGALGRMRDDLEQNPPRAGAQSNDPLANLETLSASVGEFATQRRADRAQAAAPPAAGPAGVAPAPAAVTPQGTTTPNGGAASGESLDESQLRELLERQRQLYADRGSNKGGGWRANLGVFARRLAPAMQGMGDDEGAGGFFARLGGAAVPAVANAIRPELAVDERDALQDERTRVDGQVAQAAGRTKVLGELEDRAASRDLKRAQAEKARRVQEKYVYRKQNGVLVRIGATSGIATPVTDTSGRVLDAEERTPTLKPVYDEAGAVKYYARWNPETDSLEEVTIDGARALVGQAHDPYKEQTVAQRKADEDRDASRADTNARFEKTFGLGVARFKEAQGRGLRADAARAFNIETKGSFERLRQIEQTIKHYETLKGEEKVNRSDANETIARLKEEAATLAGQVESSRSKALSISASGLRVRRPGEGAAPAGAYARQRFPRAALEGIRQRLGASSIEEAERIITSQGGTIF